jgi:hypothetical protein
MSDGMPKAIAVVAVLVYNLAIWAGAVYLIGWQSWSPWWFILAFCLHGSLEDKK